ncbi:hypothetical protein Tdes44962_MAKER02937 [Teratosphaeria destructans]|uniref:Uncharacterized protein n=1 Tax=Teratosphaeria destructans TaxID=418781 RepID=A0A9W7SR90_9PEZI|nr:hypothetical protein Tdes44962_MAKER02937 [Teratosphaeria destructans]
MASYYNHSVDVYSTAYNGAAGLETTLEEPSKALAPARSALGSRLLSQAQQASAGLSRSSSVLHSRAKSIASAYVPKLNASASPSPTRHAQQPVDRPTYQRHQSNKIFGDLFIGESAPIKLGVQSSPTKEREESEFIMEYTPTFTPRPKGPRRTSIAHLRQPSATSVPEKKSWFTRRSTPPSAPTPPAKLQDEIANLDINSALFPAGPADPLSPHAFNELLLNATALLQRMQSAYREKVEYIASVQPEIDAQKEEVEEAETRSRHLKMQLQDMSFKAAEQHKAMQEIAMQLAEERLKAQEVREAAKNSVRLVRRSTDATEEGEDQEQEKTTPRRGKRRSGDSRASDSGFESDLEYAESIMSSGVETPMSARAPSISVTPFYDRQDWQQQQQHVRNTMGSGSNRVGGEVESLRRENHSLRREMQDMQRHLQDAIDFVCTVQRS